MTEFLKGYAAGANDMEAGRLATAKRSLAEPYRGRRNDFQALSEYWAKRARAAEASALTAEEAQALYECAWREVDVAWHPKFDKAAYDSGLGKLAQIAKGR